MTNPVTTVEDAYSRIAQAGQDTIFISLRSREDVLQEAAEIEAKGRAGTHLPLAGKTVVVKDNIDVAGLPTTSAAPWSTYTPSHDAPVVARLREAGALVLGKTNMDQFATGLVGTRSPYGAPHSALDRNRVSGGSSSGSAVAVALEIADIGLGTDTAGSGRVPAAFNGIVGFKPTLGLFSNEGVVPACPSYDTVSVFARDLDTAALAAKIMTGGELERTPADRALPDQGRLGAPEQLILAVPREADLEPVSGPWRTAFYQAVEQFREQGAEIREVDIAPMLEAAALLYDGALVAERYAGFGDRLRFEDPQADPTVSRVVGGSDEIPAYRLVQDQHRLRAIRTEMLARLAGTTALLVPTTTHHPTLDEVAADPVGVNSRLGSYTNCINTLDMCAVSVPYGPAGFGLSIVADAFEDQLALDVAHRFLGQPRTQRVDDRGILLLAVGAHMRGLPLEKDLLARGACFEEAVQTAARYQLVAMPGQPPRPGMLPADGGTGVAVEGELWRISPAGLGDLLTTLPPALSLGEVTLADGRKVIGFRADSVLAGQTEDISAYGGWRHYLARGGTA